MTNKTMKINDDNDDFSIKSNDLKSLNKNLSSSYCASLSFSFDVNNQIHTDLYGKENVELRKFNLLKIPDYIKDHSKQFVDNLFFNEGKRLRYHKIASLKMQETPNSHFLNFFNNLQNKISLRKNDAHYKNNNNKNSENKINKLDLSSSIDQKNLHFGVNENKVFYTKNIKYKEKLEIEALHNSDFKDENNSINNDFHEIIQKSLIDNDGDKNFSEPFLADNSRNNIINFNSSHIIDPADMDELKNLNFEKNEIHVEHNSIESNSFKAFSKSKISYRREENKDELENKESIRNSKSFSDSIDKEFGVNKDENELEQEEAQEQEYEEQDDNDNALTSDDCLESQEDDNENEIEIMQDIKNLSSSKDHSNELIKSGQEYAEYESDENDDNPNFDDNDNNNYHNEEQSIQESHKSQEKNDISQQDDDLSDDEFKNKLNSSSSYEIQHDNNQSYNEEKSKLVYRKKSKADKTSNNNIVDKQNLKKNSENILVIQNNNKITVDNNTEKNIQENFFSKPKVNDDSIIKKNVKMKMTQENKNLVKNERQKENKINKNLLNEEKSKGKKKVKTIKSLTEKKIEVEEIKLIKDLKKTSRDKVIKEIKSIKNSSEKEVIEKSKEKKAKRKNKENKIINNTSFDNRNSIKLKKKENLLEIKRQEKNSKVKIPRKETQKMAKLKVSGNYKESIEKESKEYRSKSKQKENKTIITKELDKLPNMEKAFIIVKNAELKETDENILFNKMVLKPSKKKFTINKKYVINGNNSDTTVSKSHRMKSLQKEKEQKIINKTNIPLLNKKQDHSITINSPKSKNKVNTLSNKNNINNNNKNKNNTEKSAPGVTNLKPLLTHIKKSEAEIDEMKKEKLLEIKKQISNQMKVIATNKAKNEPETINKAKPLLKPSCSIKQKNSLSGWKSELESKTESTSKKYGSVLSSINNPMTLDQEVDFIFKKIKNFKENAINSALSIKDKDTIKSANIKDFEEILSLNENKTHKDFSKINIDNGINLSTREKLNQMKKNYIQNFIKKKTLSEKINIDLQNKGNILIKADKKDTIYNYTINKDFPKKFEGISQHNQNAFKQDVTLFSFNNNYKDFTKSGKNDLLFTNLNFIKNRNYGNSNYNEFLTRDNPNKIWNNDNKINNQDLLYSHNKKDEIINYNNNDLVQSNSKNKYKKENDENTFNENDPLNIPKIDNNFFYVDINKKLISAKSIKNPHTSINNNQNKNENKAAATNNSKDEKKLQTFQDLVKKNVKKNQEINFCTNEDTFSGDNSNYKDFPDDHKYKIKKIESLNIFSRKKEEQLLPTEIKRKPSTAKLLAKNNPSNLKVAISPIDTYRLNCNKNIIAVGHQNEKNNKFLQDKASKEKNESRNLHNISKQKEGNMIYNCIDSNIGSAKLPDKNTNFIIVNKNDDSIHYAIKAHDKNKIWYNPCMPNKYKFEKLYNNYKDQAKSLKEIKLTEDTDLKSFLFKY